MSNLAIKTNHGFGWRPDIPDFRDLDFKAAFGGRAEAVGYPATAIISEKKLCKPFNQEEKSSCVGNSVSTMMTMVRNVSIRSRMFIYYEARRLIGETDKDEGCYIRDAIKVISNLGAPREEIWPHTTKNLFLDPPTHVDKDAAGRKIFKYARLNTRDDFRKCLAAGFPFVIGFAVYDSFNGREVAKYGIQTLPATTESMKGGHAVLVFGYNSKFRESNWAKEAIAAGYPADKVPEDVYIIRNSWSEKWGRKGNFAIDARYLENGNLAADAWTIRPN